MRSRSFALHVEAVRRLDVFRLMPPEWTPARRSRRPVCQVLLLGDLDVEHVVPANFLNRTPFPPSPAWPPAARCRPGPAGGAVGDHGHRVAAAGVAEGRGRVLDDFLAGAATGRIGERQVVLVDELRSPRSGSCRASGTRGIRAAWRSSRVCRSSPGELDMVRLTGTAGAPCLREPGIVDLRPERPGNPGVHRQ